MLLRHSNKPNRGFTLIELAIVMGVIGVVTAGLWRLSAVSNAQNKDQATAQQQLALIAAVKAYLTDTTPTTGGGDFLKAGGAGGIQTLPLPASCPPAAVGWDTTFCTYLPSGFTNTTTNPYGQKYNIQVVSGTSPPSYNTGYSFMIMTSGGSTIPDADGGRISSLIGGDGGFIYNSTSVCGYTKPTACGALGAWQVANVKTAYDFGIGTVPAAVVGTVASQTFIAQQSNSGLDYSWLAREPIDATPPFPPTRNQMITDLYMGDTTAAPIGGTNIYFPGSTIPIGTSGTEIYPGTAGAIHLGSAYIDGNGTGITGQAQINLYSSSGLGNQVILVNAPVVECSDIYGAGKASGCNPALTVENGDIYVETGEVFATQIKSGSDIRFKKDIHPLKNGLADVMKLDPVTFTYRIGERKGMGVIAQELEKVYPQLISTDVKGMKYVTYDGLIGPLIESVQELKHQNDDLRAQLAVQAARIEKLESQTTSP